MKKIRRKIELLSLIGARRRNYITRWWGESVVQNISEKENNTKPCIYIDRTICAQGCREKLKLFVFAPSVDQTPIRMEIRPTFRGRQAVVFVRSPCSRKNNLVGLYRQRQKFCPGEGASSTAGLPVGSPISFRLLYVYPRSDEWCITKLSQTLSLCAQG